MGIKKSFESNPSQHSLGGITPEPREGALRTSQLHAQGNNPTIMKPGHSIHDLDGITPPKYINKITAEEAEGN